MSMKRFWIPSIALVAISAACSSSSSGSGIQAGTLITTDSGPVQGDTDGATRRFLGIPFAAPPVGELRWRPPQPVEPWRDVLDATEFGSKCAQPESILNPAVLEEDCLFLNVWTPTPAPSEPLPVMLWFHGGANETGSASDETPLGIGGYMYDGRALSEQGVVVVTTNYRLGPLGFLAHSALSEADERGVSGNQGLLDQRAAMQWVQRNIKAFGGDPDNVTIFGESAGSYDVCFHMAASGSEGLFHRAISQSGGCTTFVRSRATAEADADAFAESLGCDAADDVLACLRGASVEDLLVPAPVDGAQPGLPGGDLYQGGAARWRFDVIVDGDLLRKQPRASFDAGETMHVPYLVGSNTDEGTVFHLSTVPVTTEAEYLAALDRRYGEDAASVAAAYPVDAFDSPQAALMRVSGDGPLVCPTTDTARRAAAAGLDVFLYNFDQAIPIPGLESLMLGAAHGAELAYVFDTVPDMLPDEDRALVPVMQGYWVRHAASGDPNGQGATAWPKLGGDSVQRLNLTLEQTVLTDFRGEECAMWETLYQAEFDDEP